MMQFNGHLTLNGILIAQKINKLGFKHRQSHQKTLLLQINKSLL